MRILAAMIAGAIAALLPGQAFGGAAAKAVLRGTEGQEMGVANFRAAPHGVLIELSAKGLPSGPHAVLIHASAACSKTSGFASAGPVLSFDDSRPHGYFAKGGPRTGDLPMQFAGADGMLHATFFTTAFTLGNGAKSLFDQDGASLVVHAGADDYQSQPEGRAGARLACGPILRTVGPRSKKARAAQQK